MIRTAKDQDVPQLVGLAKSFAESIEMGLWFDYNSSSYFIHYMLTEGLLLVSSTIEGTIDGVIGGTFSGSPWNHKKLVFEEQIFYVSESKRQTKIGYKLLEELHSRLDDRVMSTMKLMFNSPSIEKHYERLGYEPLETTYIRRR